MWKSAIYYVLYLIRRLRSHNVVTFRRFFKIMLPLNVRRGSGLAGVMSLEAAGPQTGTGVGLV